LSLRPEGVPALPRRRCIDVAALRCRRSAASRGSSAQRRDPGRSGPGGQIPADAAAAGAARVDLSHSQPTAAAAPSCRLRPRLLFHRDIRRGSSALPGGAVARGKLKSTAMDYRDDVYFHSQPENEAPFTAEEFAGRLDRLRRRMAASKVDMLYLMAPES